MLFKDKVNNLQETLYRKAPDQQSYLHAKSEYPSTLTKSIAYSQTLRLKTMFYRGRIPKEQRSYEAKHFGKKI